MEWKQNLIPRTKPIKSIPKAKHLLIQWGNFTNKRKGKTKAFVECRMTIAIVIESYLRITSVI